MYPGRGAIELKTGGCWWIEGDVPRKWFFSTLILHIFDVARHQIWLSVSTVDVPLPHGTWCP